MSLEDRLTEILKFAALRGQEWDKTIAQIIQAFKDEGWVTWTEFNEKAAQCMTGQEWYDRFEKEFNYLLVGKKYSITDGGKGMVLDIEKAAKKAAGL